MEYNTDREPLKINDYGRNVVKMIAYARQLETKEERNRMANTIIDVMSQLNPKIKERTDYRQILWDHLMTMAHYDLDVDCPYPVRREEDEGFKPHQLNYSDNHIRYRHYGRTVEGLVKAVSERSSWMPTMIPFFGLRFSASSTKPVVSKVSIVGPVEKPKL